MIESLERKLYSWISRLGATANLVVGSLCERERQYAPQKRFAVRSAILEKLADYIGPEKFSASRMLLIIFGFYIFTGALSNVPILFPLEWSFGVALLMVSAVAVGYGGRLWKMEKKLPFHAPNYDFWAGIFVLGILGLLLNYMQIGIPLFTPVARAYYHNPLWSVSMIFYVMGMTMTAIKNKERKVFLPFAALSVLLSVFSGFRTDLVIFVIPLVFFFYLQNRGRGTGFLASVLAVCIVGLLAIKCLLTIFGGSVLGVEELSFARTGFGLYVLSVMVKNVGLFGLTYGRVWLESFLLQFFGYPIAPIGAIASEMVINAARSHSSTFVGPFYLEFGIIGVILGSIIVGFFCELPHRIYRATRNSFFLGLYAINLSILLVWVDTGIVQYYLAFLFFAIGLWCLKWAR
ncbi:MAG: hypothetical protein QXU82_03165 [Candidatus Aenigmatarchaeota archaeon]